MYYKADRKQHSNLKLNVSRKFGFKMFVAFVLSMLSIGFCSFIVNAITITIVHDATTNILLIALYLNIGNEIHCFIAI